MVITQLHVNSQSKLHGLYLDNPIIEMTIEIEEFVNDGESPTLQDYARRMESIPNIIFTVGLYDKTFYLLNNVQISEFEMRIEQFGSIYRYRGRVGSFQLL